MGLVWVVSAEGPCFLGLHSFLYSCNIYIILNFKVINIKEKN